MGFGYIHPALTCKNQSCTENQSIYLFPLFFSMFSRLCETGLAFPRSSAPAAVSQQSYSNIKFINIKLNKTAFLASPFPPHYNVE